MESEALLQSGPDSLEMYSEDSQLNGVGDLVVTGESVGLGVGWVLGGVAL